MSSKKKSKKSKIEVRTEFSNIKHAFNQEELKSITETLTKALRNVSELGEQKKAVVADFTAKIKGETARIEEAANKLDAGYEFREEQCECE